MATVILSSEKVIAAAKAAILSIETERERINESWITNVMKTMKKHTGFFTRRAFTREEAIKYLEQDFRISYPSNHAGRDLAHAKKLLTLAKQGDP